MRQIYLIARREYLAYVTAWGFWVSLLVLPFIISLSALAPVLVERSSPDRYYVVITDDPELEDAFERGLARGREDAFEAAVRRAARMRGASSEVERRALEAFTGDGDEASRAAAAAEAMGLPAGAAIQLSELKLKRIDPPARTPDELRPYLLGDATVATPEGPRPLHAAVFLRRDDQGAVEVDYWSEAVIDNDLSGLVRRTMRELMREEALAAAGVPAQAVERANALEPRVTVYNPERETADAEVTAADRLPYVAGVAMSFLLWMVTFSVVNGLLTGVIEEKGNKILEALLASARYHQILAGKLLGVACVTATLLTVWGLFASFGLVALTGSGAPLPGDALATLLDPGLLLPFAAYFVFGYLMFGAIFLAVGSLCETIQEAQTLMTPMIFILMVPMLLIPVAMRAPDAPLVGIVSWIPLYTPFVMMARLPSGPPMFDVVGTSIVLVASTALILWAAGRVFHAGVVGGAGPGAIKGVLARLVRRVSGSQGSGRSGGGAAGGADAGSLSAS